MRPLTAKEQVLVYYKLTLRLMKVGEISPVQKRFILAGLERGLDSYAQEIRVRDREIQYQLGL